jgi:hypothetical protein
MVAIALNVLWLLVVLFVVGSQGVKTMTWWGSWSLH